MIFMLSLMIEANRLSKVCTFPNHGHVHTYETEIQFGQVSTSTIDLILFNRTILRCKLKVVTQT